MEKVKKKKPMSREKSRKLLEATVMTAIFTAMAVVLKSITKITIPIMGAGGMAINFAGIFSFFPAILYGPVYGGVSSALCDIIGYIIKPEGAYNPLFTIVAFLGGAVKGVIWMAFAKGLINKKVIKSVLACLFVLFLAFGTVFTVSLNNDGIINGVVSQKADLMYKHEMENAELSPFSRTAVSLAKYNKDTLTLTYAVPNEDGICMLPSAVFVSDYEYAITKLDASVFNNIDIKDIYIPADYTSFTYSSDFELTNKEIRIHAIKPSSTLSTFCEKNGLSIDTNWNYDRVATEATEYGTNFENENFKFKSSDTYRKYLSGYINFMTLGFILSGALGIIIMLVAFILGKTGVIRSNEKVNLYLRVLTTVMVAGLIVTTINTFVLLQTVTAYEGRLFWIFYLPRFAEEVFISIVQAYAITILFTALSANKTFAKMLKIEDLNGAKKKEKN